MRATLNAIGLIVALYAAAVTCVPQDELTRYGTPEGTVARHGRYCLAFDGSRRCPRWVLERLDADTLNGSGTRDGLSFKSDPNVPAEFRPHAIDYAEIVFDIGHNAAAGNYGRQDDIAATMTFSNACPQVAAFNRGKWKELETHVRHLAEANGVTVWVVTVPIFDGTVQKRIGPSRVCVPSHCGKAILIRAADGTISVKAWLLPNKDCGTSPLDSFVVTTDQLETVAGLDFWSELPTAQQTALESRR